MAHFYAYIKGTRGPSTRMGDKRSGMTAHVRGWNMGVYVELSHEGGQDIARVYKTGGSNNPHGPLLITIFGDGDGIDLTAAAKVMGGVVNEGADR